MRGSIDARSVLGRPAGAALILLWAAVSVSAPALAQEIDSTPGLYERVELIPSHGTRLYWEGRTYAGRLEVRGGGHGLVVVELLAPEDYLLGIQEVPFSWQQEALKAQAVAARTYLAWTLKRGRVGAGAEYHFDICATQACQVYGGLDQIEGQEGERWAEAVRDTSGELLLYEGEPAQALYSSTTGGRTRSVEDVFGGGEVPYLRAVDSPGEASVYAEWSYQLSRQELQAVLRDAGVTSGRLLSVSIRTAPDGTGPWMVDISSEGRTASLTTWEFRGVMNRWGPDVLPDVLPAERPDGRRYPQAVLSPTYDITKRWHFPGYLLPGYQVEEIYTIAGNGWGHLVGLSQYGALAMAEAGATHDEILAHYYSGLDVGWAPEVLPPQVVVGLGWGAAEASVSADGPVSVMADGVQIAADALGSWRFAARSGDVAAYPPEGLGLPPAFRDVEPVVEVPSGSSAALTATLAAPAEVRLVVFRGPRVVGETAWKLRETGRVVLVWDGTVDGDVAPPASYRVLIEARSPQGGAEVFSTVRVRW